VAEPNFNSSILYQLQKIKYFTLEQWYLIIRLVTAFIAFFCFWYFSMKLANADQIIAGFGTGLLAYMMIITFETPWVIPTDFPEITFTIIILWATIRRHKLYLFIFSILSCVNRESSLFASVLWVFLNGIKSRFKPLWREFIYAGFVLCAGLTTTSIVRNITTGKSLVINPILGPKTFIMGLKEFYNNPHIFSEPTLGVVLVIPAILWIAKNGKKLDFFLWRLLLSAIVMGIISGYVGVFFELRVYIPIYVILAFVATAAESRNRIKCTTDANV